MPLDLSTIKDVPNKCIESAEYVIRCYKNDKIIPINSTSGVKASSSGFTYNSSYRQTVNVALYKVDGSMAAYDIDAVDIEQKIVTKYSSSQLDGIITDIESNLENGRGICVVSCEPRRSGAFTLHAATVIAKRTTRSGITLNLGYTFADDDEENGFIKISYETLSVREFIEKYRDAVKNSKGEYSVGILY